MNEEEYINQIAADLKRLRPARSGVDSRVVFYEAGFSACKSQQTAPGRIKIAPLIAAGLLAAIVTAPASYRVGRSAALQAESGTNITIVQMDTNPHEVATEDATNIAPAAKIETTNRSRRAELLASWIDPLRNLAETARIERQTGTTLAAFHSSLVQRENAAAGWGDSPFPFSSTTNRGSFTGTFDNGNDSMSPQPLAVSDSRELALSPESQR